MNAQIKKIFAGLCIFLFIFSAQAQNAKQKEIRFTLTVTDERGRCAGGLEAANFQAMVDKKPQEITSFIEQDIPTTIVFLVDLSGSQKESVAPLEEGIKHFIRSANPNNEYIVIAFNTKVQLILDKTEDLKMLEEALNKTLVTAPKGNTAFYDSAYAAIEKANSGKHQKKILIAFSDGFDNESQYYKMSDVVESLKQSDVLFYAVSYLKGTNFNAEKILGEKVLGRLAEISGGKSFYPLTPVELSKVFETIALELKNQYQIGLAVGDLTKLDKWREVKIKVTPVIEGNKKIKLAARIRTGFYPTRAK